MEKEQDNSYHKINLNWYKPINGKLLSKNYK